MTAAKQTTTTGELAKSAMKEHRAWIEAYFRYGWRQHPEDWDDLVQKLHEKLLSLDPTRVVTEPPAYLKRVAYSVLVDWANRERRRRDHVEVSSEAVEDWANRLDNARPDELAERLNYQRQIERNLQKLPGRIARVLELHYREWTNEQIAGHLGLDQATVAKYITRGTARMIQFRWDI